MIRNQTTTQAA